MTTYRPDVASGITHDVGIYAPQEDSYLLIEAAAASSVVPGARVLDFCTGTGVVAIAAARMGAAAVHAVDVCARAVECCRRNAVACGVDIDVRRGVLSDALAAGPFDVVLCNPPYVPESPDARWERHDGAFGSPLAWNAGRDGRRVLEPLCRRAPALLTPGGSMFVVHSEVSGIPETLAALHESGLDASVVSRRDTPFGPVMRARAPWLAATGRMARHRGSEEIVVVRADRRAGPTESPLRGE